MSSTLAALVVLAGSGCDGGAAPIAGGGARGGPASGSVIVFALDERTGAPIEGAMVSLGEARARTDASGRAALAHAGPVDVTVTAAGYLTEAWLGVDAAELTLPLAPSRPPEPATGTVRARLEGLDTFAPSTPAHTVRALLGATRDATQDPTSSSGAEAPTCSPGAECVRDIALPAGVRVVFAQVDEVDESGRRVAPLGFARSEPVDLRGGAAADASLLPLGASLLRELTVSTPAAPGSIDEVVGVPGLSAGGRVILLFGDGGDAPFLLPALEGDDSYWAVAVGTGGTGSSRSVARLLPADAAAVAPPALWAPPGAERDASGLRLSELGGAAMITVTAEGRWRTRSFDGRLLVPLPDDATPIQVCASEAASSADSSPDSSADSAGERAAGEWHLADLEQRWTRRACTGL